MKSTTNIIHFTNILKVKKKHGRRLLKRWEYLVDEECIRRWTCLRDRYTRECRKKVQNIDSEGNMYVWPFFNMMNFLRPHIKKRPNRTVRPSTMKISPLVIRKHSPAPSTEPTQSPRSSPEPDSMPSPRTDHDVTSPELSPPASANCQEFIQVFDDPPIDTSLICKKRKIHPDIDKSFCEAIETLKKACAQSEVRNANPAVYAFGEMIVSTICSMSSRNQIRVMQQVTDLVMKIKLDEDELMEQITY
ncbi:uncharacterized protein ACRADG_004945 isoform 2-T2 [Cochliomyia hominivorax]